MKLNQVKNILLASHGSEGAVAAEVAALDLCSSGSELTHLVVVPDLWKGMMGDDWLNNEANRDRFGRYLESELGKEVDENCDRIRQKCEEHQVKYSSAIVLGDPDKCLVNACKENQYDLVVMGSPRPKGKEGLRSKMITAKIHKSFPAPLLIIPFPNE